MKNLVGLKGGEGATYFEVLEVQDAVIKTYPSIKDGKILSWSEADTAELMARKKEIILNGWHATVTGNAVSAENDILETLGNDWHAVATSPNIVEIYSQRDFDAQIRLLDYQGLKINGAWYINAMPRDIVVELEDGSLGHFSITPYREIKQVNLQPYKGHHPRKMKGQPLPPYLYKEYGLQKNDETATEVLHTRVTPSEKAKIENAAENRGKNVSELIRQLIRELE
jgi:hypothetical protein